MSVSPFIADQKPRSPNAHLTPAARRQVQRVDVVVARPQHLLAEPEVHPVQQHRALELVVADPVEEDWYAVHHAQHGRQVGTLGGILEYVAVGGHGPDPDGLARGGDGVQLGLGDQALGPLHFVESI